jgi:hypothetical protein
MLIASTFQRFPRASWGYLFADKTVVTVLVVTSRKSEFPLEHQITLEPLRPKAPLHSCSVGQRRKWTWRRGRKSAYRFSSASFGSLTTQFSSLLHRKRFMERHISWSAVKMYSNLSWTLHYSTKSAYCLCSQSFPYQPAEINFEHWTRHSRGFLAYASSRRPKFHGEGRFCNWTCCTSLTPMASPTE